MTKSVFNFYSCNTNSYEGCKNCTNIYCEIANPQLNLNHLHLPIRCSNGTLKFFGVCKDVYNSHLCWRAFRLWKMFTRICQWILGSLDGLFWKSIVSKILTGSFLRKSTFFILRAPTSFFWPEKNYIWHWIPQLLGAHTSKTFFSDASYRLKAIQGQKWLFLIFPTSKWLLGSKSFGSMTPQSWGF